MKSIIELKKGDSINADGRFLTVLKTEYSTFKSGCKSLKIYFVEGGSLKYKLDKTFKTS